MKGAQVVFSVALLVTTLWSPLTLGAEGWASAVASVEKRVETVETRVGTVEARVLGPRGIAHRVAILEQRIPPDVEGLTKLVSDLQTLVSGFEGRLTTAQSDITDLTTKLTAAQSRIGTLETDLTALRTSGLFALEPFVRVDPNPLKGLRGPHVIFTDANFHFQSGGGGTVEQVPNGLGNVVIGYNEEPLGGVQPGDRGGSHNLVVGLGHIFSSTGGLVAGSDNIITGLLATVTGGARNTAEGDLSSVSGGQDNVASGFAAAVSGGQRNTAEGDHSSLSGGADNRASGTWSSVSGGENNTAAGAVTSISGGQANTATGTWSSISGGQGNTATSGAVWSSLSGGQNRTVSGFWDWRAGSAFEGQ
jgi:hypothetical protein